MLRKLSLSVTLTVVLSLVLSSAAFATGQLPGGGWWTGSQVQNVGTGTATIQMAAYDANSSVSFISSANVAPGSAVNFTPTSFTGMSAGFRGSAVVSSDQPVRAITNVTNQNAGGFGVPGGKAAAQYAGTATPETTLYFPMAKNNRFGDTTAYFIQNATNTPTTAQVVFKMDNGGTYTHTTPSIGAFKMVVVVPDDAGVPSSPSDGTRVNIGSAIVTGAQALAGTVLEYKVGESVATVLKGTRALTTGDFDDKAYAPVTKNNRYGRFTGIQVLNVSAGPIDVTINYLGSAKNNPACLNQPFEDSTTNLLPGRSKTFNNLDGQSNLIPNCTAAAMISGTGNFVALVSESNMPGSSLAGSYYFALPDKDVTTKISAPLFKDGRYDFSTGMQIQNVGTSQANNVVATFQCKGNNSANTPFTAISNPQTIPPGGAFLFIKPYAMPAGTFTNANPFVMRGANCGVTITADQKVVTILNESPDTVGALDDNNYEGFSITP